MLHLHGAYLLWKSMFDTLSDKNNIFFQEKCFFSSWDFILKQWRRGQHWRKLKVRFRFTETPFLPNHRTLPKPCFCRTSKPKPKFRSYTTLQITWPVAAEASRLSSNAQWRRNCFRVQETWLKLNNLHEKLRWRRKAGTDTQSHHQPRGVIVF